MDPDLLQQFRRQLATWIEGHLAGKRLPFQRLELCPHLLTDRGLLIPDMVLWINRDSQLAGSMILLPEQLDEQRLAEGIAMANALGLGHFTTWASHEVAIWLLEGGAATRRHVWKLPPVHRISTDDFQAALEELLERLKIVTVTSAPATSAFSVHYFANLCLRSLKELVPGLTISARTAAGQTADNEWLAEAPRSKAWMSLWRILALVWQGLLPPSLQPERLEAAIHYALQNMAGELATRLNIENDEIPLSEDAAVRLHHLAGRLRQLGWPAGNRQAGEVVDLLAGEAGRQFGLETPALAWATPNIDLWVNCQPPLSSGDCTLIAPRACLAAWVLKAALQNRAIGAINSEDLQSLGSIPCASHTVAVLSNKRSLTPQTREARLLLLRQAWPSRRFRFPAGTPIWLWEALYLAGLTADELSLALPKEWHLAPGILSLWSTLMDRYQLLEIAASRRGDQSVRLVCGRPPCRSVTIHRPEQTFRVMSSSLAGQTPGILQVWLNGDEQVLDLLRSRALSAIDPDRRHPGDGINRGVYLFLHTSLGHYLWTLCSGLSALPEPHLAVQAAQASGVPVPNPTILADLALIGDLESGTIPETEVLEQEFISIFGPVPDLPGGLPDISPQAVKVRNRSLLTAEQIAAKVFVDGIPRFPEHYLMRIYRPELDHYRLAGPLEISAAFFDRVTLRTIGRDHVFEVSGSMLAEALILASHSCAEEVFLPRDDKLLAELVRQYRSDLQELWDDLVRECRRCQPGLKAALRMARTVWERQGLPSEKALRDSRPASG